MFEVILDRSITFIIGMASGLVGTLLTLYFTELRPEINYRNASIKLLQSLELPESFKEKFEQRGKLNPGRWFCPHLWFHPGRMKRTCIDIADEMLRLIEKNKAQTRENPAGKEALTFYYCKRIDYQICQAAVRYNDIHGIEDFIKSILESHFNNNTGGLKFIKSSKKQNELAEDWAKLVEANGLKDAENEENKIMEEIISVYRRHCLDPERLEWRDKAV